MHDALGAALKEARDPEVRAVVLTGAGRGFCVGQDLGEFREAPGDIGDRLRATYHPNVLAIRALEKPVIAAVNGPAAGAGMSFACACDLRIAADSASFVPAFINIGLVPDSGGTFFVTRILGYSRAFEWLASGQEADRRRGARVGARLGGRRGRRVAPARGRGRRGVRIPTAARGRHDEAAARPRGSLDAGRAARARGSAADRGDADGGLPPKAWPPSSRSGRPSSKGADDLALFGEAARFLLREDQIAVREDVELTLRSRRRLRLDSGLLGDRGRETRGPAVVAASGGAVEDSDRHARRLVAG